MFRPMFALAVLALAPAALAVEPFGATPEEKAMCDSTIGALRERAFALTGTRPSAFHLHHYCDCLRFRQRALRNIGRKDKFRYELGEAVGGCDYVLNRIAQDDGIRPMVHVDKGRALKLMGQAAPAEQEFRRAAQLEPRIPEPHYELALLLRDRGDRAGALEAAGAGLRSNPGIRPLERLYLELGGKEPFPEPLVAARPQARGETPAAPGAAQAAPREGGAAVTTSPAPAQESAALGAASAGAAAPRGSGNAGQGSRGVPVLGN